MSRHFVLLTWVTMLSIFNPNLLHATVIPACVGGGNVEGNVEDGVEIDGGECGVLSTNIGTLSGNLEVKDGELTLDGDITTLSGNITVCGSCTLTINGNIGNITGSITNEGTLIITGSLTAAGKLEVKGGGQTTLDGGSFESTGDGVIIESGATVNLENGSSIATSSGTENNGTINSDNSGNSINGGVDSSGGGSVDSDLGDCSSDCGDAGLPVELVFFRGRIQNSGVTLTWMTATELNNRGFLVEKSNDGESFSSVTFVKGHGTTSQAVSYSFNDHSTLPLAYYRLKQVDFDGKYEYSPIVRIADYTTHHISFGPNPYAGGSFRVFSSSSDVAVTLVDLNGKEYLSHAKINHLEQMVKTLESGLYQLHFSNQEDIHHTMKLVVKKQ